MIEHEAGFQDHVQRLGTLGYVVEKRLSVGGMGATVLVRPAETQQHYVAKYINDSMRTDAAVLAAFFNEAVQFLAFCPSPDEVIEARNSLDELRLGFRNINLAVGFLDSTYLILEYIEGRTLDRVIDNFGQISPVQVVDWAIQICNGLIYCGRKRKEFVHRDIKPGNIMLAVEKFGRSRRLVCKVIDFGLSRSIGYSPNLTVSGRLYYTPGFAPPEFIKTGEYDIRFDVFSFGRTLEDLLFGTSSAPTRTGPQVPDELQRLIDTCQAEHPEDRPRDFMVIRDRLLKIERGLITGRLGSAGHKECVDCGFVPNAEFERCPICSGQMRDLTYALFDKRRGIVQRMQSAGDHGTHAASPTTAPLEPGDDLSAAPMPGAASPHRPALVAPSRFRSGCGPGAAARLRDEMGLSEDMSETWPPRVLNVPRPFAIDRHAVSNAQYRQFVEATGWSRPGHWRSSGRPFGTQDADWPVTHVSFHDAVAYCHWRGGELPSAAQWELAARGTDERLYPWGDRFDTGLCNSAEGRRGSLAPINAYAGGESPFGLLQSTGNVWEWVRCDAPREAAIMGGSFEDPAIVEGMAFANVTRGRGTLQSPRVGFRPILRASTEYDAAPRTAKGYEFDAVPGGTFRSGCPAAMQGHALKVARSNGYTTDWIHDVPETTVRVEGFHIGRFAVSNDLYRVFVEETGHSRPPHWGGGAPYPASTGRHPVANVSIADAFAFCRWLDPDAWLPNLLQWEKAARGIDGRLYPWGNDFAPDLVNSLETGHGAPVAVDSFADGASPCGAVNMAGNVGEWVLSHAAVRGGSFKSDCRLYGLTFYELKAAMTLSDEDTGFRCAYDNFRGDGS